MTQDAYPLNSDSDNSEVETLLSPSGDVIVPGDDWEDEWTVGEAIDFINAMKAEGKP